MRSVELFAGGGGLALGVHRAGFSTELVAEWDGWCCDTLRENQRAGHPLVQGAQVVEGDVRDIDWSGFADGVDLVSGGPPCQPFSGGGLGLAQGDARDMFPATADVIRRLRPRAFLVENVWGLTRARFATPWPTCPNRRTGRPGTGSTMSSSPARAPTPGTPDPRSTSLRRR